MSKLPYICFASSFALLTSSAIASDFNLPFVNTAGLGVAYADWATAASDASTSYTNPAGLVYVPKQAMVNLIGMTGDAKFTGSALTPPFPFPFPVTESGTARSSIQALLPSLFYSMPLVGPYSFGFGVNTPFGLGTNYGRQSIVRYTATQSKVLGVDVGPSLGIKLNDLVSVGAGLDALYLTFTLNNMYGPPLSFPFDAELRNQQSGWGCGWHAGALLNVLPQTRVGVSYNSRISIHTTGYSTVYPLLGGELTSYNQQTSAALPARAQLSFQHDLTPRLTGMFTAFYTHWKTFKTITLEDTMVPSGITLPVTIPFHYDNTFDFSFGAAFKATEYWAFRAGLQLLTTPSNDRDRGVADPIGSATIVTLGAHFQQNPSLGYDIGIGHSFFAQMPIQYTNTLTSLQGYTNTQTTVIGGQVNWTIV